MLRQSTDGTPYPAAPTRRRSPKQAAGRPLPRPAPETLGVVAATGLLAAAMDQRADLDPVAAGRIEPGNRRRVVRALEVTLGSGRRFSEYGPGQFEINLEHCDDPVKACDDAVLLRRCITSVARANRLDITVVALF